MGVFRLILNVLYFFLHIVLYLVDMDSEGFSELQVFSYGIVVLAMTFLRTLFLTFCFILEYIGLPCSANGKESACSAGDRVRSLGWEDPLEKVMAIHSSILAWRIPWTEKPGGLQSVGSQRVGHD